MKNQQTLQTGRQHLVQLDKIRQLLFDGLIRFALMASCHGDMCCLKIEKA